MAVRVVASAPSRLSRGLLNRMAEQGEGQSAEDSAPEAEGGTFRHGIIVPAAQGTAHHTGTSHAEQVIDGIEGQHHRCCQGNGGILDGVIQHTYKVGIRQVVEHHDQRAENGGNCQCGDCFGNRGLFKEQGSVLLQGISSPEKSFRAPVFRALSRKTDARSLLLFYHIPDSLLSWRNEQNVNISGGFFPIL